ncbi:hypothetical protein DE146DRAFT_659200 [Phaeosphaeria sp. MPI-PUGE-AT-0046c]|nr:hypothetical protein DE146DRAFT_659200 [Phaeosphaeria sp. MPI-PUGE-AT-0046c]
MPSSACESSYFSFPIFSASGFCATVVSTSMLCSSCLRFNLMKFIVLRSFYSPRVMTFFEVLLASLLRRLYFSYAGI